MWWDWRNAVDNGYQMLWKGDPRTGPVLTAALAVWRGFPCILLPSPDDVAGCFALTLPPRPDIFFTMKPVLFTLLFSGLLACTSGKGSELDERQLARVVVEVIQLHHRYSERPDSMAIRRKAVLQGVRFTEEDLDRLTAAWKTDPEALELLAGTVMESLKADSVFVRWKKTGKRNTAARRHERKKK